MADERKHIDNLFKDQLVGHKVAAPAGGWDRLQADLQPRKKHGAFFYIKLAAASLLLLIAFGAGYFLSKFNTDNTNLASSETETTIPKQNDIISSTPAEYQEFENNDNIALSAQDEKTVDLSAPDNAYSPQPELAASNAEKNNNQNLADTERENNNPIAAQPKTNILTPEEDNKSNKNRTEFNEEIIVDEEIAVVPKVENTAIETEISGDAIADAPDAQFTEDELEKMTPEQLHLLLVGDTDFNDVTLADNEAKTNPKWTVGGQLSPTYSYRNLTGDAFQAPDENIDQSYFNDNENGLTTIGGGISLAYNFNDRLSLGSGLYLSRIGQENNDVVAYDSPDSQYMYKLASSSGTVTINPTRFAEALTPQAASVKDSIPGDYLVNGTFVQNLDYLEVPLVLNYKVLNNRFSINLNGGLSPGILVNNRSYFSVEDEKIQTGTTENIKPMIYNSVLGIGLGYDISKKVSVNLSPTFKYSLSPVNSGSRGINYHPYSISWFTGISYKL